LPANKAISSGWGPKPSAALKNYMDASKGTILVGDIQAHMLKEHAKPSTRRQDIIHPSEMAKTDWCPRSTYFRIAACREAHNPFLKPAESVGVQLLNIFDEGHLIHDKWQKRLRDMGVLWGNWECRTCGNITKSHLFEPNRFCEYCERFGGIDIYREVPLKAEQYLIAGHADGAVPHVKALIEIKSVGEGTVRIEAPDIHKANTDGQKIDLRGLWKDIEKPFPSHIRQGQLYLRLCSILDLPFDQIIFIYEAKFNQGVKEFVVKYDPAFCDEMLDSCLEIKNALDCGLEIPKCPTGSSCKDCEKYGTQKSDILRLEPETGPDRIESTKTPIRRPARTTVKIVRNL
jgi:hypothetical protein